MEILHYVAMEFATPGPVTRQAILDRARGADAPTRVISTLERLPERRFTQLRQLWEELPGIPIGAA